MYCVLCILWCILWASGPEINVILSLILSFTNDLIAQVCQLCHNIILLSLMPLISSMLRPSDHDALLLLILCLIGFVTSAGRTAGTGSITILYQTRAEQ